MKGRNLSKTKKIK